VFTKNIPGREEECHVVKYVLIWQGTFGQHVQKPIVCTVFFRLTQNFFRKATAAGGGDILGFKMQEEYSA